MQKTAHPKWFSFHIFGCIVHGFRFSTKYLNRNSIPLLLWKKVVYILHSLIHTLAKLKHKLATFAIPRIQTLDSFSAYTIAKRKPSLIVQGSSILLNLFQLVLITLSHSMHELSSFCLCSNGSVLYLLNPYHSHLLQYPLPSTEGELCTMISLTLKM